jgi:hypothetical protein
MIQDVLLNLHIAAGFSALLAACVATVTKALNLAHKWHVVSGRIFFGGMTAILLTAVPLSLIGGNSFLLLVSIFSFYLAAAGWSYARNRRGTAQRMDWVRSVGMAITSVVMAAYGILQLTSNNNNGIIMLVFSIIGAALSIGDIRTLRAGGVTGKERISRHLTMMLAGFIACITAFVTVNFRFNPNYVLWLAPTVVITPIIVIWNIKISKGVQRKGMPDAE